MPKQSAINLLWQLHTQKKQIRRGVYAQLSLATGLLLASGKRGILARYCEAQKILRSTLPDELENNPLVTLALTDGSERVLGWRALHEIFVSHAGDVLSAAAPSSHSPPVQIKSSPSAAGAHAVFLSGSPAPASYRYRVLHPAESLSAYGCKAVVADTDVPSLNFLQNFSGVLICHRCALMPSLCLTIEQVKHSGGAVVFDTDDLVFDPGLIGEMDSQKNVKARALRDFIGQVERQRDAIAMCDAVTASTGALTEHVSRLFPNKPVMVSRNMVNAEMLRLYDALAVSPPAPADTVTAAYFSGTQTHQRDFAECADAVAQLLEKYPQFRLLIVGLLDVSPLTLRFPGQVEICPLVPWQKLPELYGKIDINLAPLEMSNEFTRCKSDLKYYEAAFAGKPTVASNWGEFARWMKHGETGLLCSSPAEWRAAIEGLIVNPQLRAQLGAAARADVRRTTSLAANPAHHAEILEKILAQIGKQNLLRRS